MTVYPIRVFFFCEAMLEKYALDKRINMITGTSYLPKDIHINVDYFFRNIFRYGDGQHGKIDGTNMM